MEDEIWKPVHGFNGYEVSNFGRVRSWRDYQGNDFGRKKPIILRQRFALKRGGYPFVQIVKNRKYYTKIVHKLVLNAFVGYREEGYECRHLDGNPRNNNLSNIKWGTSQENTNDLIRHGWHRNRGEKNGMSSLTKSEVFKIKRMLTENNLPQSKIANIFGVSQPTISEINTGKRWGWI